MKPVWDSQLRWLPGVAPMATMDHKRERETRTFEVFMSTKRGLAGFGSNPQTTVNRTNKFF